MTDVDGKVNDAGDGTRATVHEGYLFDFCFVCPVKITLDV